MKLLLLVLELLQEVTLLALIDIVIKDLARQDKLHLKHYSTKYRHLTRYKHQ
jgi:hypothetical protein